MKDREDDYLYLVIGIGVILLLAACCVIVYLAKQQKNVSVDQEIQLSEAQKSLNLRQNIKD